VSYNNPAGIPQCCKRSAVRPSQRRVNGCAVDRTSESYKRALHFLLNIWSVSQSKSSAMLVVYLIQPVWPDNTVINKMLTKYGRE